MQSILVLSAWPCAYSAWAPFCAHLQIRLLLIRCSPRATHRRSYSHTHIYTHCLTDWRGVKSSTPGSQSRQFSFVRKIVILPLLWWSREPCLWLQESAAPLSSVALTKLLHTASCQPALSCLSSSPTSCRGRPRFGLCPPIRPPCPPALPLSCLTSLMKVCLFIFPDSLCCPSPRPPTFSMCTFQFFPASPPLPCQCACRLHCI